MNKPAVLQQLRTCLSTKQSDLQVQITDVSEGLTNDTKSSAGDKYETARSMGQQEMEKLSIQLQEINRQLALLTQLEEAPENDTIQSGSLVTTTKGAFFIGIPAGQVTIGNTIVFCISPASPLAQQLLGKSAGTTVTVNGNDYAITGIL